MKIIRWAFAALLLACGSVGFGQTNTFTKFAPATGVLKGSSATYVTSAAVAADIKGLWSGTCDATTFLRGDGSCAAPTGTGITFSMPAGFTVTGSPGSTISVTTALSGVLKGTGSAFTTAAAADIYGLWSGTCSSTTFLQGNGACAQVSLTTEVTGTLGVTNGGSGLNSATLGDLHYASATNTLAALAGNTTTTRKYLTQTGTGTVSAAPAWGTIASADVISGWTGTCNSTTFLRADGSCVAASGGGTPGGSNTQVQYNSSGSFAGDSGLTYISGTRVLTVGGGITMLNALGGDIKATDGSTTLTLGIGSFGISGAVLGTNGLNAIQFVTNNTVKASLISGLTLNAPTGGDKGSGTINAQAGIYVNGTAVPAGVAHLAACYVTVSGTTPTLVNTFGCSGVSRAATGHYTVTFNAGFGARPPCTVSAYGGDFIAFTSDPSNSGTMDFLFDNITGGTRADPAGFMIVCLGN